MSKNKKMNHRTGLTIAVLAALILCAVAAVWAFSEKNPGNQPAGTTAAPSGTQATLHIEMQQQDPVNLGFGLQLLESGKYTGMYMEDGTNDIVADVMMIVVENTGPQDVQYAAIHAVCGGETFRFSLTNLAVGEKAVLLEQDRRQSVKQGLDSAVLEDPVLFPEPMSLQEDRISIGQLDGMLNVKNISQEDITGDIYVYYKYAAQDIFYGGITFRVRVEGGLKAGDLRQIPAGHFTPEGCRIVQVSIHG